MIKVLGIGDNVVDKNYTLQTIYPGGNSFNFAVFSSRLGHQASYAGTIANDLMADIIMDTLAKESVDTSKCQFENGETGICGIHLNEGDRVIVDENDAGAVKKFPFQITEELLNGYVKQFDLVHSSCYSYIESQLKKVKDAGVKVLYDFSDEWTEEGLKKICPDINLIFFSGGDRSFDELEKILRKCVDEYGCEMAVTTAGIRGALVYNGRKVYRKLPYNFKEPVIDTTGAGDSWITAFVTTYYDNWKLWNHLHKGNPAHFTQKDNQEDFEDYLIEFSMCTGNLFARRNCLEMGAVGNGVTF